MEFPAKRKHCSCQEIKQDPDARNDRDQRVRLVMGSFVQCTTWQRLCTMVPLFHAAQPSGGAGEDELVLQLPQTVDPWAVHTLLLARLNDGLVLDCSKSASEKFKAAAGFLRITGYYNLQLQSKSTDSLEVSPAAIHHNFSSYFMDSPFHIECSLRNFLKILRSGFLAVRSEMDVYEAVMKWCHHAYPSRWKRDILQVLMAEIRWDLLPNMLPFAALTAASPLKEVLLSLQTAVSPAVTPTRVLTAVPTERHFSDAVFLFHSTREQLTFKRYDWRLNRAVPLELPKFFNEGWIVNRLMGPAVGHFVWFTLSNEMTTKMLAYDAFTGDVHEFFSLETNLARNPAFRINDGVYGFRHAANKKWELYRCFPTEASLDFCDNIARDIRMSAAWEAWNGKLFYCGGVVNRPDQKHLIVNWIEEIDFTTKTSRALSPMVESRRSFAVRVCNGYLYATGGGSTDSPVKLKSSERLCLIKPGAQWERLADLRSVRFQHTMFVVNNRVYVCGGRDENGKMLTTMEAYDEGKNRWEEIHVDGVHDVMHITNCAVVSYNYAPK